jgi:cytochrome c oxidase subunit III
MMPRAFEPALGSPRSTPVKPERSETGVWIGIFAIVMSFAAFTSAMIVRQGAGPDWRHFALPRVLYLNTLVLLISSLTMALAGRRLASIESLLPAAQEHARRKFAEGMYWLHITLTLGGLFVFGQIVAWRVLAAQGLFLATNPSSSFFYVFTAMHGLHLLGGMAGLIYMQRKLAKTNGTARTTGMRAMCTYWHFMGGLWVYLLVVLIVRT